MSLFCISCSTHYAVDSVTRTTILIDTTFDRHPNEAATEFVKPYKSKVDSMMSPVVGHTARQMSGYRPESPLSNLLADILVWASQYYDEKPVLGVYNVGGIRAALPQGAVSFGDVLEVAPFENKICFLTLRGDKLLQLFSEMAASGGEGVSHGVELVIGNGKLYSAKLYGKEIDPQASYRITTINYLAEGNDHLDAFKTKTDFVSPQDVKNNTRFIIADYFKEQEKAGRLVNAEIEGRIIIKN